MAIGELLPTFLAGAGLGGAFVAGLAWTVRRGVAAGKRPGWYAGSFAARALLAAALLAALAGGDGARALAAFAGFMLVRPLAVRWCLPGEVRHAPEP